MRRLPGSGAEDVRQSIRYTPEIMDQEKHNNSMVSLAAFGYSDFTNSSHSMVHCFDSTTVSTHGITGESFMAAPDPWQQNRMMVDDSSLRCLFPVEQQSAHEVSLTLRNPDAACGFQQPISHVFSKPNVYHTDGRFFQEAAEASGFYQHPQQLKSSKYLIHAQQLLNEFCGLGGSNMISRTSKSVTARGEGGSSSSSSWNNSLLSLHLLELQKRKARLLTMLEEVDRRYRKYCEQMRCVVSGFEAAAGEGTANVYSVLASKAMSKHFRSLRDGIVAQIKATNKAMGEKDTAAPGASRGETPRLRVLDQCLRQQRAFQQTGMMESQPWRPQRGLPERAVTILRAWLFEHFLHPYPSDVDKHILARQTGLSRSQVSNWFINARVRLWKPMVEEMYVEETKEQDNLSPDTTGLNDDSGSKSQLHSNQNPNPNPNASQLQPDDQKPAPGQLLINDSDSLSSIINSRHRQPFARPDNYSVMELDFSSYNESRNQTFGNKVSLTLGLQQHNEGGVNLSFSPASQNSHFFSRESMDGCQPVQFEMIDGDGPNLPYRNLMGAQLLHDLAG